ncbi:N-acetylmannosaminyltransferase (EC [Olavius algarvensis associated proteobacterium Delta 3]|nr:N-acetylmannosaminyltransferase (EC [Olavius algarvensis associated proteobacterium Delta 3]CAB5154692.1 N-acetylmannosaminyltransferase (EC [Olavius algarvensis associated proteobacterium Delta 3]
MENKTDTFNSKRLSILNIWVDDVNRCQARSRVQWMLECSDRAQVIFASNPEKNFSLPKYKDLYHLYQNADLLLPDGIGMVLAARLIHGRHLERVPGVEFFFDICKLAVETNRSIFIYGSREEVNERASRVLSKKIQGLDIAGRSNGYVKENEMEGLVNNINQSGAQILFIALGSPKQERWYATYRSRLKHVRVCQCIGGTLDTLAGNVKRAPDIWCRMNLEWLYRLIKEPKRIKRQRVLPIFAFMVLLEAIRYRIHTRVDFPMT